MACGDLDGLGVPGAGCIRVRQPEPRLRRLAHGLGSPRRVRGAPEPRPQAPRRRTRIPGRTRPTLEPGPPGRDPSTRLHPECCPAAVTGSAEAAGCCLRAEPPRHQAGTGSRPGQRLALARGPPSGARPDHALLRVGRSGRPGPDPGRASESLSVTPASSSPRGRPAGPCPAIQSGAPQPLLRVVSGKARHRRASRSQSARPTPAAHLPAGPPRDAGRLCTPRGPGTAGGAGRPA